MTNMKLLNRALLKCKYNKALLGRTLGIKHRQYIGQVLKGERPLPAYAVEKLNEFMGVKSEKSGTKAT